MKKIIQLFAAVLVVAGMTGCASTRAYLADRVVDARDILTLGVEGGAIGFSAQAGPIMTGAIYTHFAADYNGWGLFSRGAGSYHYGDWQAIIVGYKGGESKNLRGRGQATLQGGAIADGRALDSSKQKLERCYYALGNVDIRVALGLGFHAGIHLGELADFLLGWFTVDIMSDDIEARKQKLGDVPEPVEYARPAPETKRK